MNTFHGIKVHEEDEVTIPASFHALGPLDSSGNLLGCFS